MTAVDFKLYLVTDRKMVRGRSLEEELEEALKSGIKAIQLREKDFLSNDLFQLTQRLRKMTTQYNARLFVNDRFDVALASEADGVHCPENALPVPMARKFLENKLVGASTHSVEAALDAEEQGADFVVFGPIFATPSKDGIIKPKGLKHLEEVTQALEIPVIAIGGIKPDTAKACLEHGAKGVAVVSAVLASDNIPSVVSAFEKELGGL